MMYAGRFFVLTAIVVALAAGPAFADSSAIKIDQAWARATPGLAKTGAIYLTITNTGTTLDTLEGTASSPAAAHADLHKTKMENGIMEMRPVPSLAIAPGQDRGLRAGRLPRHVDRA